MPIGQAAVVECVVGWNYPTGGVYGQYGGMIYNNYGTYEVMSGTVTLSTASIGTNTVPQGFTWFVTGTCPTGYTPAIDANGPIVSEPVWTTSYLTTWYVTISAICSGGGGGRGRVNSIFMFPWEWNPPTLPIWLWLRGGTNTIAPLEPIYIQAFNAYANWFWANAGWFIDLLILLALITPILARPIISRRIRV